MVCRAVLVLMLSRAVGSHPCQGRYPPPPPLFSPSERGFRVVVLRSVSRLLYLTIQRPRPPMDPQAAATMAPKYGLRPSLLLLWTQTLLLFLALAARGLADGDDFVGYYVSGTTSKPTCSPQHYDWINNRVSCYGNMPPGCRRYF